MKRSIEFNFVTFNDNGKIVLQRVGKKDKVVKSRVDLLVAKGTIYSSSSLDFPEQYTEDQETIALAHSLRAQ